MSYFDSAVQISLLVNMSSDLSIHQLTTNMNIKNILMLLENDFHV